MATVGELLGEGVRRLRDESARREAVLLLRHVLGVAETWLITHADAPVDPVNLAKFRALVERRARGEPVAYLTRRRGFHVLELQVGPDVLIPRAETELLVDLALQRIPVDPGSSVRAVPDSAALHPGYAVADLGTGSGAVALAIAKARPRARVVATDASEAALDVARGNAERLGLRNVDFAPGDWYDALGDARFDLIVSNPPYVADDDPHLREGDLRFEPRAALASGTDGLDAIRAIVAGARRHLVEGGWLLFEHGYDQGPAARVLLDTQRLVGIFTARDLEGLERVSGGRG